MAKKSVVQFLIISRKTVDEADQSNQIYKVTDLGKFIDGIARETRADEIYVSLAELANAKSLARVQRAIRGLQQMDSIRKSL